MERKTQERPPNLQVHRGALKTSRKGPLQQVLVYLFPASLSRLQPNKKNHSRYDINLSLSYELNIIIKS